MFTGVKVNIYLLIFECYTVSRMYHSTEIGPGNTDRSKCTGAVPIIEAAPALDIPLQFISTCN